MRSAEEIYQEMLAVFTEKTGFSMDGAGDVAVRLYAAAAQIESLYLYSDWALAQSFPQTAQGEYLDLHGAMRGVARKAAEKASGTVRFSVNEARADAVDIPAGTVLMTTGLTRFVTKAGAAIAAGSLSADVPAEAERAGASGNAAAGTVTLMAAIPPGVSACTNPEAFTGGADAETDEDYRARVLASFSYLPNGANSAFYETRALSHAGVAAAAVTPRVGGIGTVGVTIASNSGVPDAALLEEVRADLAAAREIAVDVTVSAPSTVTVALRATLKPAAGVSFEAAKAAAEAAVRGYFTGARLGKPVYRAVLGELIYGTGLVENYTIKAPAADVKLARTQLPVLGTLTLTEAT